jgi:subtilisin family serine protease
MKTRDFRILSKRHSQLVISYCLAASIIFFAIPVNLIGGKLVRMDDSEEPGERIFLSAGDQKNGKASVESSAEARGDPSANEADKVAVTTTTGNSVSYDVLNVEFQNIKSRRRLFSDSKQSKLPGAFVITVFDKFADIFATSDEQQKRLQADPTVLRVEYHNSVKVPLPPRATPSSLMSQGVSEGIVRGGYGELTGKKIPIVVIDTGLDHRHPDFINYDAAGRPTSRIALLWDTTSTHRRGRGSPAPVRFPHGPPIGTVYTTEDLTNDLRSPVPTIPCADRNGHGTACASIAAGNGNADWAPGGLKRLGVKGVAPEADIIIVRIGDNLENSYLLNAICEWLDKVAQKTPLVISGSFGGQYSGHDGQRVEERQLNARFPLSRAGRAIIFAAGNEGDEPIHSKVNFSQAKKMVTWIAKRKCFIKIYFDSADAQIAVSPSKATPLGSRMWPVVNRITNQREAIISVDPGAGRIWFENASGRATEAHLYFMESDDGSFAPQYAVPSHLVASPGTMGNAITVGAYIFGNSFHSGGQVVNLPSMCRDETGTYLPLEVGWLSCYSSPGPARNGTVKPEIAAPGEWFSAANAKDNGKSVGSEDEVDSTGNYRRIRGTSAAAPYTAGIVALMFQKKPTLTLGEVKALIQRNVSKTELHPAGSGFPNKNWGYGRLDKTAVDGIFAQLESSE